VGTPLRRVTLYSFFSIAIVALGLFSPAAINAIDRELVVSGDYYYPPFEFTGTDGEPTGFNVELFKAVADVMDLDYRIELRPWSEARGGLESGEVDLLIGLYYSESRDRLVDFTTPHSIVSHTVFVRQDSAIRSEDDLQGKEILVQKGDIVHDYLTEHPITDSLIPVVDQREALILLDNGFYDAAYISKLQGLYFKSTLDLENVRTLDATLIPRRYCFAVQEGDAELQALLNEGLNILKIDGTYDEIYDRWFGVLEREELSERVWRVAVPIGGGVLGVIVLLVAWLWSLRRTVRRRTAHLNEEIARRGRIEEELRTSHAELERSLSEKSVLLAEVHHRVKNNLQIISSLLELQRNAPEGATLEAVLTSSQSRIDSMALLHDQLYNRKDFVSINLRDYVEELLDYLCNLTVGDRPTVEIVEDVEEIHCDLEQAVPLGLMISEIVTNSLKYAFVGRDGGTIRVAARHIEEGAVHLELSDNGIGFDPEGVHSGSLGLVLIQSLVEQLRASIVRETSNGTRYSIHFTLR
jgi:two-component sensor histidine kinase/ABC-type amino acid transport substrate-binding protein